jgi:post-segregation antitoxin (ccd killing protein)
MSPVADGIKWIRTCYRSESWAGRQAWRHGKARARVHSGCVAEVNITVPDDLIGQARAEGLNVSSLVTGALIEELDRRARRSALNAYLADLEAEIGPLSAADLATAEQWANRSSTG